jgi:YfiH family protein
MMDVIYPEIINSLSGIEAVFTLSNRSDSVNADSGIGGLNFGINTSDKLSAIQSNRKALATFLNVDHQKFVITEQVHGDHIEIVDQPGFFKKTDGVITVVPGLILTIQVADCAAVMVADQKNMIIGVFHAGWRGAVKRIVSKGIKKMEQLAIQPPQYKAFISPCISQNNFEVGSEVAEKFPSEFVDYTSFKKPHVNLKQFLKTELMNAGVNGSNIEVSDACTMDDPQFYSFRREREEAGRMLACLYINENLD